MTRHKARTRKKVPAVGLVRMGYSTAVVVRCGNCKRHVGHFQARPGDASYTLHGSSTKYVPRGDLYRSSPDGTGVQEVEIDWQERMKARLDDLPVGWYFECRHCEFVGMVEGQPGPGRHGAAEALAAYRVEMRRQTILTFRVEDPGPGESWSLVNWYDRKKPKRWASLYRARPVGIHEDDDAPK